MSGKKLIEALWDCPFCGQKGIGGLTKICPNCGHKQDENTVFYMGSKKNYLSEEKAQDYGNGADWLCSYCGSFNRYNEKECTTCGAPREEQKSDYFENKKAVEKKRAEKEAEIAASKAEAEAAQKKAGSKTGKRRTAKSGAKTSALSHAKANSTSGSSKRSSRMKKLLMIFGALFAVLLIIFWPRKVDTVVAAKSWERSISIEEYKTVQESDWSIPQGGRQTSTKREIHHYDHVIDHYEDVEVQKSREVQDGYDYETSYTDNGDGTYSEHTTKVPRYTTEYYYETERQPVYVDVPVYQTKYYYDIERWVPTRSVDTSGNGTDTPVWGDPVLADQEREGERTEKYTVTFRTSKGKEYTTKLSEELWNTLKLAKKAEITVSGDSVKKVNGVDI
ncbi:MAG: hypothetical protein Q4B22_10900 [Eubacteriales bacterium]|nr:hypothetical protein [Eubacteriales bacterium]